MPRTSDARRQLLEAAIYLIRTSTYGAVSVDQICAAAGVKKGSFYHFFPSKEDLALSAFEDYWQREIQPEMEQIFAPSVPPLERLQRWCDAILADQREFFERHGRVPGCPLCTLGSEAGPQSERLRRKAEELLERGHFHLVKTIEDAQRAGLVAAGDPQNKARLLTHVMLGAELEARVQNDLAPLEHLGPLLLEALGARRTA